MRFNPPPDWPPVPPGWTPPPGWEPDPSWPPPPSDWQLWLDDAPAPSRRSTRLIVGGVAAVLLVIVGVVVAVVATRTTPNVVAIPGSTSTSAKSPATSAEDQIKAAVTGYQNAWNNMNFAGFKPIVCQRMQEKKEFNESDFLAARQGSETVNFSIQSIQIRGDKALATVKAEGGLTRDIPFVRESDGWKWCDP